MLIDCLNFYTIFIYRKYKWFQGEFKVYFKAAIRCSTIQDYDRNMNFYFSKISYNASELRGNMTFTKQFDESLSVCL